MSVDADVLVVGLGPVGAALAALLVDEGLSVLAIDRETAVYPLPRAAHFDHEIMRLFQQLGVAEAVLAHAQPAPAYEFRNAKGDVLMRFDLARGRTPSGWPASYMFHQPGLENALRARLGAASGADVRLGERLTGLTQDSDGVTATLETADGGQRTVRVRYLVGCDGASSAVRGACGIALDDYAFDEPWLVIDVRADDPARVPEINLQICDPAGPTTCVLMGPGRHRWEFMLRPGETPDEVMDDAYIRGRLADWGCGDLPIERKAVYRFHGLVARRWREGRVLLAGDAAHQTPPFAGQGMCSGLRDAANLAWKLGAVRRGAGAALLDSYQQEREPHTRALIERAIGMGRVVCMADPEAAAVRDAGLLAERAAGRQAPLPAPPAFTTGLLMAGAPGAGELFPQPVAEDGARLDDVLGKGPWLIGRDVRPAPDGARDALRHVPADDPRLAPFQIAITAWLDKHGADAVLVRPDRVVFGAGAPAELVRRYAEALGLAA
ncbi:MAG TPA: bifunctional 3-(3-hydroxy-phenyl)propionate/3-hydroxycinnamic acid hydroxylase [Caulobacteraceae bacterium]